MNTFRSIFAISTLFIAGAISAEQPSATFDPMAVNIEENIAHPSVPAKNSAAVSNEMNHLGNTLREKGFSVDMVRKGEVVMVTIPCSKLFAPNSLVLSPSAESILASLEPYIKRSDKYKVILAAHSDNTGDEMYAERITAARANAIDEYFFKVYGDKDTEIIPYGLGADEPIAPNSGIANREKNRRIEIYFVPTAPYIDKIKRNNGH